MTEQQKHEKLMEILPLLKYNEEGFVTNLLFKCKNETLWGNAICPNWDFNSIDYKIASEPKYVPYTSQAASFLLGRVVKKNDNSLKGIITEVGVDHVKVGTTMETYKRLLDNYVFDEGEYTSPCGKWEN